MIWTISVVLLIFSDWQAINGVLVLLDKYNPLLPKERKKLPPKYHKKAKQLNGISMIVTSAIFYILSAGMMLDNYIIIYISAGLMLSFILVMLFLSYKYEAKHLKKN